MDTQQEELRLTLQHQAAELDGGSMVEQVRIEQEEIAEQAEADAVAELTVPLTMLIAGAGAILAPNWQITQEESGALAEVYAPVITKYFPNMANFSGGVEMNAAMVTLGIVGARVMAGTPRKLEPETDNEQPVVNGDMSPKATCLGDDLQEDVINVKG